MPTHDGFGFHDEERGFPAGPEAPERGPEETVPRRQLRSWSLVFERRELLPQSDHFNDQIASFLSDRP